MKVRAGSHSIEITHPDKVLFPKGKITKEQLVRYYLKVGSKMVPLIKDRPISMKRYPNGIHKGGFFQKNAPETLPSFVKTAKVTRKEKGKATMILCNNVATLAWLANQNCITPHIWLSKVERPDYPDRMVFDLDPPARKAFSDVVEMAHLLRDVLKKNRRSRINLMVTGSKGLHLVVPITPNKPFDEVREFAREIAEEVVNEAPKLCTTAARKASRKGRIYIDVARNGYGQTVVAPYAVRPLPSAPLAIPVSWSEVGQKTASSDMHHLATFKASEKNPWQ